MKRLAVFCLMISLAGGLRAQTNYALIEPGDNAEEIIRKAAHVVPSARQLRWQKLELTAFFHFGINTFTGREWGDGKEDPALFNPSNLDTRQWVRTVKEAGFKQVILTAKHHDGFCLWPTNTTEHSVKNSPWKNGHGDVVKELSEACQKEDIGFGIYLSPWDRNAPLYGTEAYNDFFVEQLTELLTQYGRIDEVWFDGANGEGSNGKKQVYDFERWYQLIRKLQPQAVIAIMGPDVRWVGTETGQGRTQEWSVVPANNLDQAAIAAGSQTGIAFKPQGEMRGDDLGSREKILQASGLIWYPAETDVSIRPGWFYHDEEDAKVKSPKQLLEIYLHSVGRNGVLLLNIPPNRDGLISEKDVEVLRKWKALRDKMFRRNLARKARITVQGRKICKLTDGAIETGFTASPKDATSEIQLQFKREKAFNVLCLQENITRGQRVERFVLEYLDGNEWKKITEGTTVGYKRILRFDAIKCRQVRLRILSSRLNPVIGELGLYAFQTE